MTRRKQPARTSRPTTTDGSSRDQPTSVERRDSHPRPPKLQRWLDLLAALLSRTLPADFNDVAKDVPAYADDGKKADAIKRMFERDKDELRAFGVPIESVVDEDGGTSRYRLRRQNFYLPYLYLLDGNGGKKRKRPKVDRYGYQSLIELAFEPDELAAIGEAAARVHGLGDPSLMSAAGSAMRKLVVDLPLDATLDDAVRPFARASNHHDPAVFLLLADALQRRKAVAFDYRSMERNALERREVHPYGIFFLSANCYLVAHDPSKDALRNFRLTRIGHVTVNGSRAQTPDYVIPPSFHLRQHAKSQQAWELGDGDAIDVTVRFTGDSGAIAAARALGDVAPGDRAWRVFHVRRPDAFARWLLTFGGHAVPLAPTSCVDLYQRLVRDTRALYANDVAPA